MLKLFVLCITLKANNNIYMSITLAGSEGGIKQPSSERRKIDFIPRLFGGNVSYEEYEHWYLEDPRLELASLVINNSCNLRCRHCYLQVKELTRNALSKEEWGRVIDSIAEMRPSMISINGKEIFVSKDGPVLLLKLRQVKQEHDGFFDIGFITNGTLLHQHYQTLLEMNPDYVDISLDGMKEEHNALRGKYAFERTWPNIEWALQKFDSRFFISTTLQKLNVRSFISFLTFLQEHGIQNVVIGFYKPLNYTDQSIILSEDDLRSVFYSLYELSESPYASEKPLSYIVDVDLSYLPPLLALIRTHWFQLDRVEQDTQGQFYMKYSFGNITLLFRVTLFPMSVTRVRITPEGNLLVSGDTQDTTLYPQHTIGNVRDYEYNFAALYDSMLHSERLKSILREYYQETLPLLRRVREEMKK